MDGENGQEGVRVLLVWIHGPTHMEQDTSASLSHCDVLLFTGLLGIILKTESHVT